MTDDLKTLWEDLKTAKAYQTRLDPSHPLDFFAGVDFSGKEELILITVEEPVRLNSSRQLKVDKRKRKTDDRWATQIILENQENVDVFSKLCTDLMDVTRTAKTESEGIITLSARFISWQKLFSNLNDGMSESVIKGLIGELKLAMDVLESRMVWPQIIQCWMGPEGGDRDYVFDDSWFEVKAISTGKSYVTISSINQLEVNEEGILAVYNVDKSNSNVAKAFSLESLIRSARERCKQDLLALQTFDNKLLKLGYCGQEQYKDVYYTCSKPVFYKVDSVFPKLTGENVAFEIIDVRYDISLPAIEKWRVEM